MIITKKQLRKEFKKFAKDYYGEMFNDKILDFFDKSDIPDEIDLKKEIYSLRGCDAYRGIRIIYPDGKVEYQPSEYDGDDFSLGCTSSRRNPVKALCKCIKYDYQGSSYYFFYLWQVPS